MTRPGDDLTLAARFRYTVVIPVFNSVDIVGSTIDQTVAFFESSRLNYELVLVNDGSHDGSWEVIRDRARDNKNIIAINLLRNYGQHVANICGLRHSSGDYVITMDDDGQNPPHEIRHLIATALKGNDVVFGRFEAKQAPFMRSLGSKVVSLLNRRIFGQPKDLAVSNFRIIRRDVVDRMCASKAAYPYITGLALINSRTRANVTVQHAKRASGKSTYTVARIVRLIMTILFSYSLLPLRVSAVLGAIIALGSFAIGGVYLFLGVIGATRVPGWASVIVLLAVLNGVTILMLSMLGEYTIRVLNQVSNDENYHVIDVVATDR